MTEDQKSARIQSGTQWHSGTDAVAVGGTGTTGEGQPVAALVVRAGADAVDLDLHPGEQFSFGDEVWELTEIDQPGHPRAWVTITRVS